MSKPRYKWWGYIRRVLCAYPELRSDLDELKETLKAKGENVVRGSGAGRPVEVLATATLPDRQEQRELEAVEKALNDADEVTRKLAEMVFFKQTHKLYGAALTLFISYETAKRRQKRLILAVAENLELLE